MAASEERVVMKSWGNLIVVIWLALGFVQVMAVFVFGIAFPSQRTPDGNLLGGAIISIGLGLLTKTQYDNTRITELEKQIASLEKQTGQQDRG